MRDLYWVIFKTVVDLFRPRAALEAEILVLRQQIVVLRRGKPGRLPFSGIDRMVLGWVCHLFPTARGALAIVRPDTVVRWHRVGLRCYWRFKSRRRRGHPGVPAAIRQLIREMSLANPLWGAPRIHGELLKLGIDVGQTSVAKYRPDQRRQIYGAQARIAVPGLEDVSAQPCGWHCGDGPVCRSDRLLPAALWAVGYGPWPATNPVARRHRAPNGGLDRQSTDGGLWLGANPPLSDPRSGCLLWPDICPTRSLARDSRSSNLSTLTLAKWLCGAPDRLDPQRMPGSYCGDRRAAPSPHPSVLHGVLQCGAYPPFTREGCADSKGHSVRRTHRRSTRAWGTAPSIRADLICDKDNNRNGFGFNDGHDRL
jgi:hypothetical protein